MSARRPITALAATAAALVLLSGCAAIGGIGGQSKLQACADLSTSITKAAGELSSAFQTVQTDPAAAHDAVVTFNGQFKTAIKKVSNGDVQKPAQKAADDIDKMADAMQAYKLGSDPAALEESGTAVQDDFGAIAKVCSTP